MILITSSGPERILGEPSPRSIHAEYEAALAGIAPLPDIREEYSTEFEALCVANGWRHYKRWLLEEGKEIDYVVSKLKPSIVAGLGTTTILGPVRKSLFDSAAEFWAEMCGGQTKGVSVYVREEIL